MPNRSQKHTKTLKKTSNPNRRAQQQPTNNENTQHLYWGKHCPTGLALFHEILVTLSNHERFSQTCMKFSTAMGINMPNRIQKHINTLNKTSNPNRRAQKWHTNDENIQHLCGGKHCPAALILVHNISVNLYKNARLLQKCINRSTAMGISMHNRSQKHTKTLNKTYEPFQAGGMRGAIE